ncbi:MAG TPA: L-threonylcarbamoyladenylate synthase [Patescibacteria group bacterium]|nr:L-threonylcarbamoyladenylate synthase [Patescibacteria group bacterium]
MAALFDSLNDKQLIQLLKDGAVGVLPTDTVYGLVCVASNPEAVERLYKLKNRYDRPGTLIAANIDQLVELGFKRRYLKAVEQFWPGPVSVETPYSESSGAYIRQTQPTIAVRIPADKKVIALLLQTGPLLTSSANAPEQPTSKTIEEAEVYFQDNVDFYVDGGDLKDRKSSTIIRIVDDEIEVLREGAVKIDANKGIVK